MGKETKKLWMYVGALTWVVIMICIFSFKSISAIQELVEIQQENIDTIKDISRDQGEIDKELFSWCQRLGKQNIEQKEIIDRLNNAIFGEMQIGEDPE